MTPVSSLFISLNLSLSSLITSSLVFYSLKDLIFSELLPIFSLASPDTIRLKDEGLLALYKVRGIDSETFGSDFISYSADRLEDALKGLGENWTVSFFLIRKRNYYYPDIEFKSSVSEYIDEKYKERVLRTTVLSLLSCIFLSLSLYFKP